MFLELEKKLMIKWLTKLEYKKILGIVLGYFLFSLVLRKDSILKVSNQALPFREAALLMGMVWGEKSGMKGEFYSYLVKSGLVHIVVVSGANLMIVSKSLIENLAKFVGRKMAILGGGGAVLIYVNLVGWQLPIIRALLFLGVYYFSQILGRKFNTFRAMILVVVVMFLADWKIYNEASFWLSIMAFTAVLLNRNSNIIKINFWVNIFIIPILSINFKQINLISPLFNMMVLFLVEAISIVGFWGGILGVIWQDLGSLVLAVNYPLLRYLIEVIEWGGKWKWMTLNFQFNWWMFLGWYLILGAYWYEKKKI